MFLEILFLGRGGQGVVTAGRILAEAALHHGLYVQTFPEFGPERSGAPVRAYVRISDEPIEIRAPIESYDMAGVFEKRLLESQNIVPMIKDGGILVAGSSEPLEIKSPSRINVYTVDAKQIIESLGRPRSLNLAIIGALASASGIVSIDVLREIIAKRFGEKDAEVVVAASRGIRRCEAHA
ncbi:MAG: 2-oxoacid:acceptor oxidoreductase family protein [Nitrososphaerota archaeon]